LVISVLVAGSASASSISFSSLSMLMLIGKLLFFPAELLDLDKI
jgi:hypothetical protein